MSDHIPDAGKIAALDVNETAFCEHQTGLTLTGEPQDDPPCTDCDDTGITGQTERFCSCHAGRELSSAGDLVGRAASEESEALLIDQLLLALEETDDE